MFKTLTTISSRIRRSRRPDRHVGTTIGSSTPSRVDRHWADPVVPRPLSAPVPPPTPGGQPPALDVEWTRPEGVATGRFRKRLDDNALIIEAGRAAAKGFYRGDPMNEPGFAALFAVTISDLTRAYLSDRRAIAPQITAQNTGEAVTTASDELTTAQRQYGPLARSRPSVNAAGDDAEHAWIAGTQAFRIIKAAEDKLTGARAALREAESAVRMVATEMARSLGVSARIGANRLRRYHEAFNDQRLRDGHATLDPLPEDLDQMITVQVIRAARLAMNPEEQSC